MEVKTPESYRKLDDYIEHGERVGGRKRSPHTSAVIDAAAAAAGKSAKRGPEQTRAIRDRANANGYEVVEASDAVH